MTDNFIDLINTEDLIEKNAPINNFPYSYATDHNMKCRLLKSKLRCRTTTPKKIKQDFDPLTNHKAISNYFKMKLHSQLGDREKDYQF